MLKLRAAVVALAALLWAHPSSAITIANNSFELPDANNNGTGSITSWVGSGAFGTYAPVNTQYPAGANGLSGALIVPDGDQAAYLSGSSIIKQTLTDTLQVGTY